ncbi:MAG: erythromycin esterase family protein [Nitrososphaeraceae archaeon]
MKKEEQQIGYRLEEPSDLDPLFVETAKENIRYVLLGEASHGTSEFYSWRTEITKRLISEQKFSFIAVEGDWPDCYNVNRYVKGMSKSEGNDSSNSNSSSAYDVLFAFNRWPTWMWANREIVDLIEWLRKYNERLPEEQKVGFYGLDVYSLWESMESVIKYLKKVDPDAIKTAIEAYRCFEPYGQSVEDYARATAFVPESCEDEVIDMLIDLRSKASQYKTDGLGRSEEYFNAEQNAIVAKNAELYYRKMIQGGTATWNIRDTHMMDTLSRLMEFYDGKYDDSSSNKNINNNNSYSKSIVWAHNTHVGDARQTDMASAKMINIGQLVREHASEQNVMIVGFGTYKGTVIAAKEWGENMERVNVPPAIEGSLDNLLHKQNKGRNSLLLFKGDNKQRNKTDELLAPGSENVIRTIDMEGKKGQRAIGVVYNPEYEKYGNYVPTILTKRYDAFLYIDETHALSPLHMPETQDEKELPETFPTGL